VTKHRSWEVSEEENEMVRLCCVTRCRRWEGLGRRVMDGETLVCDNMLTVGRSEEKSDGR